MSVPGVDIPGEPESEGRFTMPTDLCAWPERWTSTDGDSTEIEVSDLAYGLVRALQPRCCVETGSGHGQTTRRIADAIVENGHGHIFAIENHEGRADALRDIPAATVVCLDSLEWTPPPGTTIDFAWLDSWYEFRVPEFVRYQPWMRSGTIVCFHDSAPGHGSHRIPSGNDLRTEVEDELKPYGSVIHLPTPRGVSIFEVR